MWQRFAIVLAVVAALFWTSPVAAADVWHDYLAVQSGEANEAKNLDPGKSDITIKVTNGTFVDWREFKSLVRIIFKAANGKQDICSGVLVGQTQVLTAGHCACGTDYVVQSIEDEQMFGIAGYPRIFPGYYCASSPTAQAGKDLAMLNISDSFDPSIVPRVAHLFDLQRAAPLEKLAVVGFGLDENNVLPTKPKIGFVPVFSLYCSTGRAALSACQPFREFALSGAHDISTDGKVDTCGGDSGGPVFAFRRKRLSEHAGNPDDAAIESILVGITSRPMAGVVHIAGTDHCGGGGIYTSVGHSDVLAWLSREGVNLRPVTSAELAN